MSKIKVGIIGAGGIVQLIHLPHLTSFKDVEVPAIADISRSSVNSMAKKFRIGHSFTDYREMLDKIELDAVIIATPTVTHRDIAIECINRKLNVLIEKPVATSLQEGKDIVDAADKNGVVAMAGMNMRYRPDIMLLKSILSSEEIGKPFHIKCGWFSMRSSTGKWAIDKKAAGGGVIYDLGIVVLDLALWLLKYPGIESVSTKNYNTYTEEVEDSSMSFIRCKPDSLICIETSWALQSDEDSFYLDIYGTGGSAFVNPLRVYKKVDQDNIIDLSPSKSDSKINLFKKSYENELKHFIGAVKGLNPVLSPASESLSRLKIIEAMYESASRNKEVRIS